MGTAGEGLVVAIGGRGWARYFDGSDRPPYLRLRFGVEAGASDRPRVVIRELWATSHESGGRISARLVRNLPLGRIEAAVNAEPVYARVLLEVQGVQPDVISMSYPNRGDWDLLPLRWFEDRIQPRLKLELPEGRRKPDEFLAKVIQLFDGLRAISNRPASDIAEANDVPVTTVHGWVKEARRRGLHRDSAVILSQERSQAFE